jgi:Subtilase family
MYNRRYILDIMKIYTIFTIALTLVACTQREAEAKHCGKYPIKIAVIDTGFGYEDKGHTANLCRYGHKDFSIDRQFSGSFDTKVPVPLDIHSHGTNIVGIIDDYAKKSHLNYCIVVIKFYSGQQSSYVNMRSMVKSIQYAANIKADYVNISGGGNVFQYEEYKEVKRYLNGGGKLIVAAMNDNIDIDLTDNHVYPAMYDPRIIVVGSNASSGVKSKSSNYGNAVKRWEVGENVTAYGITMTGTSQATAVATGKIASENANKCDIGSQ